MLAAVAVAFLGGPEDGSERYVKTGADDTPPPALTVLGGPTRADLEAAEYDHPITPTKHRYACEVSALDDGPLWIYRYVGAE